MTPPARLLDLSRLVSRMGQGAPTGVDRVELAYLQALLARETPLLALVRRSGGFCLLDRAGVTRLAAWIAGADIPDGRDMAARWVWRRAPARAQAETAVRAVSVDATIRPRLRAMLRRHLPAGFSYLNTGHSNLDPRVFAAVRACGGTSMALIHDVIPLDHPEVTRPDTRAAFARRIEAVARGADIVLCNSADTATRVRPHLEACGRVPRIEVAHLGSEPLGAPGALPAALDPGRAIFAVLGTIEPRKNHALLLDVWQVLAARLPARQLPQLAIIGRRGWSNAAVFARLDAGLAGVVELGALDDLGRAAVLHAAHALLFPSRAEGFGLPALEAAGIGLPVLATLLPVFGEILAEYPVYLPDGDVYSWAATVEAVASVALADSRKPPPPGLPQWDGHFNHVLSLV